MVCILIVTVLASTNLSIIAPFIVGLSLGPSWAVAGGIGVKAFNDLDDTGGGSKIWKNLMT